MRDFLRRFRESAAHYKSIKALTLCAMFIALNIVLDFFSLQLTPTLRLGFGFLTSAMVGMLFGPAMAMGTGFATDILSFLLINSRSGGYFPGFTISAIVGGLIYGTVLYKWPIKLWRSFAAKGLINVVVNIGLNTLWLSFTQGKAVSILIIDRIIKNACLWPLESTLLFLVSVMVYKVAQRSGIARAGV